MNFHGGVMTQAYSDARANMINTNIANGTIIAYDGEGTVIVEKVKDNLVVKGLHPLNPVPGDGDNITAGDLTLNWTLAAGTLVDVWFGTSADLSAAELIVTKKAATSATVKVDRKKRYYWAVDTYAAGAKDPNYGPIFDFYVDNLPPVVEAGDNARAWLNNGSVNVAIAGTVTDADPTTTRWTVSAFDPNDPNDPNELIPAADFKGSIPAVIANADKTAATVTLSALGTYQLKLEANDGEYAGSDTVTISVFSSSCEAAKSVPDYQPLPGDINGDCRVNDEDLTLLQAHWLECNALDCNSLP